MASPDRPFGLRPIGTLDGSPWYNHVRVYSADASRTTSNEAGSIFVGDPVKLEADGNITVAAATETPLGVCVGVNPFPLARDGFGSGTTPHGDLNLQRKYLPANVAGTVLVCVGHDILYVAQEDGDTDPLELADIGQNVDLIAPTEHGSTTTGLSLFEIDSSSHVTTNTVVWRLVDFYYSPENELESTAKWIIKMNLSQWQNTTGI